MSGLRLSQLALSGPALSWSRLIGHRLSWLTLFKSGLVEHGLIELRLIEPRLTWSKFSVPRFQKISNIITSFIWGLVSNTTPFHRKQSIIDMEDRSNILLENPKCLNLSSI